MTCPNRQGHTLTEIAEVTSASPHEEGTGEQSKQLTSDRRNRKGSGLDSMVLAELKQLASSLGIKGTGAMRKSQLIEAIQSAQRGSGQPASRWPGRQDNGHRSLQDGRDNRDVASALDELQRAPREASDRARGGTDARTSPYNLSWSQPTQPSQSDTRPAARAGPDRRRRSGPRRERRATGRWRLPAGRRSRLTRRRPPRAAR